MNMEHFTLEGADGRKLYVRLWRAAEKPRAVLQIIHGMAEHGQRYEELAQNLNNSGITVAACDLRGHGRTGELNGDLRHLDQGGFLGMVRDQEVLMRRIRETNPGIPLFLLGHSMGSFLAFEFIKHYGNHISGAILSGSSLMKGPEILAGSILSALFMPFGSKRPNRLIDRLSFGSYNKAIENPSGKFAWLSRDEDQVTKYERDPFCGMVMSTGFYRSFFKGLSGLYDGIGTIPKSLPVCLVSGDRDPVGKYGSGVRKLWEELKGAGMTDLQLKLYPGGRHEMLNELNRSEVYAFISQWLDKYIGFPQLSL